MNVVTVSGTSYRLDFYAGSDVTGTMPVTISGSVHPYVSYTIAEGSGTNQITITSVTQNAGTTVRTAVTNLTCTGSAWPYTWTKLDWHTSGMTVPVQEIVANVGSTSSGSPETRTIENGSAVVATSTTRLYYAYSLGRELVSKTLGTTYSIPMTYQYYASGNESAGFVASASVNGHWEGYEYQANTANDANDGIVSKVHRQFLDSSTTVPSMTPTPTMSSETTASTVTAYTYQNDAFGVQTRPLTIETKTSHGSGTTTAYSSIGYSADSENGMQIVVASRTDRWSDTGPNSLSSENRYYREDTADEFYRNRPYSATHPDYTKESYAYQRGSWSGSTFTTSGLGSGSCSRMVVFHGTTQSSNTSSSGTTSNTQITSIDGCTIDSLYVVTGESTRDVVIRDANAHVVYSGTDVYTSSGWQTVQSVVSVYNSANQVTSRTALNGDAVNYTYSGEQLATQKDAAGIVTTYSYDDAGRISQTSVAAASLSTLITTMAYDAANHVLSKTEGVSGGGESIVNSANYDDAGRVTQTVDPNAGTTGYVYDPTTYKTTTTFQNTGTQIDITYPDGRLQSETGTGVVPRYFSYSVGSDGSLTTKLYYATNPSHRSETTQVDMLGRTLANTRPTTRNSATFSVQNSYDATRGLLTSTRRTDGSAHLADTCYLYDGMAQCYRQSLDVADDGGSGSSDRITDTVQDVESYSSDWWKTTKTIVYPQTGSSSSTGFTTSIVRQRLTGLAPSSDTTLRADQLVTDSYGTTTETKTHVDLSANTVTTTTSNPGFSSNSSAISEAGLTVSLTGFDGLTTAIGYDNLWRPATQTDSRSNTTTTTYVSGKTLVLHTTDANSVILASYTYDSAGRPTVTTNANSKATYVAYDTLNHVIEQWGDLGYPVEYGYDAYGSRTTMKTFRNGTGWTSSVWPGDPSLTDTTTWAYDDYSGLLLSKADASSNTVLFTYDNYGRTLTRQWARGTTTTYHYDVSSGEETGELTKITYSDATPSIVYTYNRAGQLSTVQDATTGSGAHRTFWYDSTVNSNPLELESEQLDSSFYGGRYLSRLYDTATGTSGTTGTIAGRPIGIRLGSSENSSSELLQKYTYSDVGQFAQVQVQNGGASRNFAYTYLSTSPLVSGYSDPSGSFSVSRAYEAHRDLLTSIKGNWSTTAVTEYDLTHNSIYQTSSVVQSGTAFSSYGSTNGATFRLMTYNDRGELTGDLAYLGGTTSDTSAPLPNRDFVYSYDPMGNRSVSNFTGSSGLAETYTVNKLNQYIARDNLSVAVSGNIADDSGTVVKISTAPLGSSPSFPSGATAAGKQGGYWAEAVPPPASSGTAVNQSSPAVFSAAVAGGWVGHSGGDLMDSQILLLTIPPQSQVFVYDQDGNLSTDNMWGYTYDAENRLIQMQTSVAAQQKGVVSMTLTFVYDYLGRRVEKIVYNSKTGITTDHRFLYDGWNLVADYTYSSSTLTLYRTFAWGLDVTGDLTAAGGVGSLLEVSNIAISGGTITPTDYFPTYDGSGNIASLIGNAGAIAAVYEYSPFGEPLRAQINDSAVADSPFKFSTKFTDVESGLIYYGNRFYSPALGRFLNRDPMEEAGGINLYGFVNNGPANAVDVLGFDADSYWRDQGNGTIGGGNGQTDGFVQWASGLQGVTPGGDWSTDMDTDVTSRQVAATNNAWNAFNKQNAAFQVGPSDSGGASSSDFSGGDSIGGSYSDGSSANYSSNQPGEISFNNSVLRAAGITVNGAYDVNLGSNDLQGLAGSDSTSTNGLGRRVGSVPIGNGTISTYQGTHGGLLMRGVFPRGTNGTLVQHYLIKNNVLINGKVGYAPGDGGILGLFAGPSSDSTITGYEGWVIQDGVMGIITKGGAFLPVNDTFSFTNFGPGATGTEDIQAQVEFYPNQTPASLGLTPGAGVLLHSGNGTYWSAEAPSNWKPQVYRQWGMSFGPLQIGVPVLSPIGP